MICLYIIDYWSFSSICKGQSEFVGANKLSRPMVSMHIIHIPSDNMLL